MAQTTSQAIQAQIADLARDLNNQVAIQNTYRTTGTKGIQGAYRGLDTELAANQKDVGGIVNRDRSQIITDYGRAGTNISDAEKTLRAMLGTQGGLEADPANGPLAEIKKLNAERALSQADSLASSTLLGTGYNTQARQARADASREGTQQVSSLTSQIGADIGEMQRQYLKEKAAAQVQYAQALAEEKYKAEQMALERARLASENAARAAASRAAAAKSTKYEGRAGVLQWAAENHVPADQLKQILAAVDSASASGHSEDAYSELAYYTGKHNQGPLANNSMLYKKGMAPQYKGVLKPVTQWDNSFLNSALDIFYGKYSGAGGE